MWTKKEFLKAVNKDWAVAYIDGDTIILIYTREDKFRLSQRLTSFKDYSNVKIDGVQYKIKNQMASKNWVSPLAVLGRQPEFYVYVGR